VPTDNQTFHFLLSRHIHSQSFSNLVIELICSPSCSHNTKLSWSGSIELLLFDFVLFHEFYAVIYPVRLEGYKIQPSTRVPGMWFSREVYKLRQRTSDLPLELEYVLRSYPRGQV